MSNLSDYTENLFIDHILRNQAYTPAATVYLALFTAVTGLESGTPTTELSGNGYTRQALEIDAASGGSASNTNAESFTASGGNWGTVSHCAVVDHASATDWGTGVHVLMWSALDVAKNVQDGDTLTFAVGSLDFSLD